MKTLGSKGRALSSVTAADHMGVWPLHVVILAIEAALVPLVLGYMALASGTIKTQHMPGIKHTPRQLRTVLPASSPIRSTCRVVKHAFSRAHYRVFLHESEDEPETLPLQHSGQVKQSGARILSQDSEPLHHPLNGKWGQDTFMGRWWPPKACASPWWSGTYS